jgi:hypothetical protein
MRSKARSKRALKKKGTLPKKTEITHSFIFNFSSRFL